MRTARYELTPWGRAELAQLRQRVNRNMYRLAKEAARRFGAVIARREALALAYHIAPVGRGLRYAR